MALALAALLLLLPAIDQARSTQKKPAPAPQPYTTNLTLAEMSNKQAVVNTAVGTFVIDLRPDLAPNHVGYFIKLAGSDRDRVRHDPRYAAARAGAVLDGNGGGARDVSRGAGGDERAIR